MQRIGRGDPGGIEREAGWDAYLLQNLVALEDCYARAREVTLATGQNVSSFVGIIDMHGQDVGKYLQRGWNSVPGFKKIAPIMETHYPV